eukprot:384453_1
MGAGCCVEDPEFGYDILNSKRRPYIEYNDVLRVERKDHFQTNNINQFAVKRLVVGRLLKKKSASYIMMDPSPQWLKRWVIVKDSYLLWSNKHSEINNTFSGSLHLSAISHVLSVNTKSQTQFKLIVNANTDQQNKYTFKCQSKQEKQLWIKGLKFHIIHAQSMIKYVDDNHKIPTDIEIVDDIKLIKMFDKNETKENICDTFVGRLQRLKDAMKINVTEQDNGVNILLNDYLFLLQNHNTNNDIEFIYNELGGICNSKQCKTFRRHYRNVNNVNWRQQIIDKIHCFYRHTFDIGYMLNTEQRYKLQQEQSIDKHVNYKIIDMINNQRTASGRVMDKYIFQKQNSMYNMYSFGTQFKYGYDEEDKYKIYDDIKEWTDSNCINVLPKYKSFKQ